MKPCKHEEAVWLLRCQGATLQVIADAIGISRERVRQVLLKRERRLRRQPEQTEPSYEEGVVLVHGLRHAPLLKALLFGVCKS